MKCVTKGSEVKRVSNEMAADLVEKEGWRYTNKQSWKKAKKEAGK